MVLRLYLFSIKHCREKAVRLLKFTALNVCYFYITQKQVTRNERKGWLNSPLKSMEIRNELSITLHLQSKINFCSERMPVNA